VRLARSLVLSFALVTTPLPLQQQSEGPRLEVAVTSGSVQEGPAVSTANLLNDAETRDLLRHGFPAGIHYRLELWRRGGVVDDFDGRSDWDVLVSYDPTRKLYSVVRKQDSDILENFGAFTTVEAAEAQFGRALRVPLRPNRAGRYYYNLIVEVQVLTETDLDALQQWMRGPDRNKNPFNVIGRGFRKLLSRVLGGAKRHYEQQSASFQFP
jgi:hypothetical protein